MVIYSVLTMVEVIQRVDEIGSFVVCKADVVVEVVTEVLVDVVSDAVVEVDDEEVELDVELDDELEVVVADTDAGVVVELVVMDTGGMSGELAGVLEVELEDVVLVLVVVELEVDVDVSEELEL